MKSFKKLAAIALAAVLALAMLTACGNSTKYITKADVIQMLENAMISMGRDLKCNNTDEMDQKANMLLEIAQKNYKESVNALDLLTSSEAIEAARIDVNKDSYRVSVSVNPDFAQIPIKDKADYIVEQLSTNMKTVGLDKVHTGNTVDVGVAFGTIGEVQYIIFLQGESV